MLLPQLKIQLELLYPIIKELLPSSTLVQDKAFYCKCKKIDSIAIGLFKH